MAVSTGFLISFVLIAIPTVYAAQHVVGGSSGWTNFGVDYDTWAAGETFNVGDTLLFTYGGTHSVAEVSESDYSSCSASNAIKTYNDGSTTITLSKAGPMCFICSAAGHCGSGMKLKVNVVAAPSGSPTTPTTPTPAAPNSTTPGAGTPSTTSSPPPPAATNAGVINFCNMIVGSLVVLGTGLALMV